MRSRKDRQAHGPPELSTRGLIEEVANGPEGVDLTLGDVLDHFRERAYGVLLLICVLPAFVPLPVGAGAVSGPFVMLVGLQLLAQLEHPWVPGFLARRALKRSSMESFRRRTARVLGWLEKISRPRAEVLIDSRAARVFTGLLLVVLGFLLALPLPGTNYPFGAVLLLYAIALIERDGRTMAIAWIAGIVEIVVVAIMSKQIAEWLTELFA